MQAGRPVSFPPLAKERIKPADLEGTAFGGVEAEPARRDEASSSYRLLNQ